MEIKKKNPVGIENYKAVVSECYYVDKTLLIKELCDLPQGSAILFTRPRRFGKSLALSMIQTFFERGEDNSQYFKNLAIGPYLNRFQSEENAYPLIHFVMKNIGGDDYPSLLEKMKDAVSEEYARHEKDLLSSPNLNDIEKDYFQRIERKDVNEIELSSSLKKLTDFLQKCYQKDVVILIDEYDNPIEEARLKNYYAPAIDFFRSFYGEGLKRESGIRLAVISGVLQIAKESLFSGLNNLLVSGITSPRFNSFYGFTEEETKQLLDYYGYASSFEKVRSFYGGYHFGGLEIFNPWSVLNYAFHGVLDTYWTNTGRNASIGELLSKNPVTLMSLLNQAVSPQGVLAKIDAAVDYKELGASTDSALSFLASAGYLSLEESLAPMLYRLALPNQEIQEAFSKEIKGRFLPESDQQIYFQLQEGFRKGSAPTIEKCLETILTSFSYFEFKDERNYQALLLAINAILFGEGIIKSEVPEGKGRCDIQIAPKTPGQIGIVIEVKHYKNTLSAQRMKETSDKALEQIKAMDYTEELIQRGATPIFAYGISFIAKKVSVSSAEVK